MKAVSRARRIWLLHRPHSPNDGNRVVKIIDAVTSFQNKPLVCDNDLKSAFQGQTVLHTLLEKSFLQLAPQISRNSYVFDTRKIATEGPSCKLLNDKNVISSYIENEVNTHEFPVLHT